MKTTFNFKFGVYDVLLENQIRGIETQIWFKTLKLKAPYSDGDFIYKYFNLFLSRKTFIKKCRAKGELESLWETKSSDVCGI